MIELSLWEVLARRPGRDHGQVPFARPSTLASPAPESTDLVVGCHPWLAEGDTTMPKASSVLGHSDPSPRQATQQPDGESTSILGSDPSWPPPRDH